jgi:hypothetical protein
MSTTPPAHRLLVFIICAIVVLSACRPAVVNSPDAPADYTDVRFIDMRSFTL